MPPPLGTSHQSKHDAGWRSPDTSRGSWLAKLRERRDPRWTEFSWLTARSLLDSANDQIAKGIHDLVNARRMRWVAAMRAAGVERAGWDDLVSDMGVGSNFSCLVVGDPGEGDGSQYAVAEALLSQAGGTAFMFLLSDVIYPAGDVNDYTNAFYLPYDEYRRPGGKAPPDRPPERPIVAVPGNHDWYDGLAGFMWHLCGAELLPPTEYRKTSFTFAERAARFLWQQSSRPRRPELLGRRNAGRGPTEQRWGAPQPGPYFAIDTPNLLLVGIDTGITGRLDREQGDWLRRVSARPKDKILLTGKPLIVDGEPEEGEIEWGPEPPEIDGEKATVDAIVRQPGNRYVAAIGGDIHNFQRYTVKPEKEGARDIEYLVAGGGGAYLSATHRFGPVDYKPPGADRIRENDFYCYPSRGDSVAFYSRNYMRTARRWALWSFLFAVAIAVAVIGVGGPGHQVDGSSAHELWKIALFSLGTLVVVALVLVLSLLGLLAGKGYRMFTALSLFAAGVLAIVAAFSHWWPHAWHDLWPVAPLTVGVIAVPLLVTIVAYYYRGLGPRFSGDLVLVLAVAVPVAVGLGRTLDVSDLSLLLVAAGGLAGVAAAVPAVGHLLNGGTPPRRKSRAFHRLVSVLVLIWIAGPVLLANQWVLWSGAIALVVVLLVIGALFWWGLLRPTGMRALFAGHGDPDAIYAITADRFRRTADKATDRAHKANKSDRRSRWLVDYVLGKDPTKRPLYRAAQDKFVSEIGDTNDPPLFRSFLKLSVTGDQLRIECFGVTGWAGKPKSEQVVEITLETASAPRS